MKLRSEFSIECRPCIRPFTSAAFLKVTSRQLMAAATGRAKSGLVVNLKTAKALA